jgi:hypothetical protein
VFNNAASFVIGDGTNAANYLMQGGTHAFTNGLVISSNAVLSGCGSVIGAVTNYGTIILSNNCDMAFQDSVINFGTILVFDGTLSFQSTFINNGSLLWPHITGLSFSGTNVQVHLNTASNYVHELQVRQNLESGPWTSLASGLLGTGDVMTVLDSGGATNAQRFYRLLTSP